MSCCRSGLEASTPRSPIGTRCPRAGEPASSRRKPPRPAASASIEGEHSDGTVPIPEAYELDDLTFALLWACASLDNGLQADDQELTATIAELAPYEELPSSAVSREAAANLGTTAHM